MQHTEEKMLFFHTVTPGLFVSLHLADAHAFYFKLQGSLFDIYLQRTAYAIY